MHLAWFDSSLMLFEAVFLFLIKIGSTEVTSNSVANKKQETNNQQAENYINKCLVRLFVCINNELPAML